ncbi:hypothetical protein AB3S75_023033 [Citrus x aurantiifolia]
MAAPATLANFMGMKPQLLVEESKATNVVQFYKTTFAKNMGIGCVLRLEIDDVEAALAKAMSAGVVAEGKLAEGDSACCSGLIQSLYIDLRPHNSLFPFIFNALG